MRARAECAGRAFGVTALPPCARLLTGLRVAQSKHVPFLERNERKASACSSGEAKRSDIVATQANASIMFS